MATKKKDQVNKNKELDVEVNLRETSSEQLVDNEKLPKNVKKHKCPDSPRLIKLYYKKSKLKKLRRNYGANLDEQNHYFLTQQASVIFKRKENQKNEQFVKNINTKNKKTSKKKKWLNFLYFALNILVIAVVLWVQLSKESDPSKFLSSIVNVNWWFILAALATFFVCMIVDQIKFISLIHKATGVFRFNLAYKISAVGRHYDVITPLSTGGQPFQVFYANKYGIKAGEGVSIAMGKYIFHQIIYFLCVSFVLIRNLFTDSIGMAMDSVSGGVVTSLSWIGYAVCAGLIVTIMFISFNRRVGTGFIVGILKLLSKIKIGKFKLIKDYKKSFVSVMKTVNSWQTTTRQYSKSFSVIIINVVTSIINFLSWYSMPFFVYCAFNGWDPSKWGMIVTMAVMVDLSSAFNPIPMGIGTADLSFTVLFASLFVQNPGAQVWALIIWRFLAFYIYILQGLILLTYDYTIGDKRLKKYKEYWMLPCRERLRLKRQAIKMKNANKK